MKVTITFKDPDAVFDAARDAAMSSMPDGLSADERLMLERSRTNRICGQLSAWVRHGEYLTVEFDLEAGTARVVEAGS